MAKRTTSFDEAASPADRGKGQWLLIRYLPTALFSLRMTHATSKGGKTLLAPTPYAVKLAFVDACFRMDDADLGSTVLQWLKGREIRFRPPEDCVVQNTFLKVQQEKRDAPKGVFEPTIAYREFCFYRGELTVAIGVGGLGTEQVKALQQIAAHINYLGKRGSFMQFTGAEKLDALPDGFTHPMHEALSRPGRYAASNYLDDIGEEGLSDSKLFDRINTYSSEPLSLGKQRVLVATLLPYRLVRSSQGFSHYRRID